MGRARFLPAAQRDLAEILEYLVVSGTGRHAARRFVTALRERCHAIASLPGTMGRQRDDLSSGMRSSAHGNYIIMFMYDESQFMVVRIVEGHRDLPAQIQGSSTPL